jgi:multidrug efflux pump subunit AcrB
MVKRLALVGFLMLSALALSVQAQSRWPERPVRIVVPYAAGGNTDGIARITAQALQEKRSATSAVPAFSMALLMVFLILAALYEKWSLPVGVILTVPFALLGALVAIFVRGSANDIYFQIGLVTLIGLAAKNAILIVEFAVKARDEGKNAAEAAIEAARIRFRPLVMTSMAFVLGVVPLVIAAGAGAGARRSMGTGVFGGMLFDTFVATLFIPLFFKVLTGDRKEPRA